MVSLRQLLILTRCPHCRVSIPHLEQAWASNKAITTFDGQNERWWAVFSCSRCGGLILCASDQGPGGAVTQQHPKVEAIDDQSIPERAKHFLNQAIDSLHSPSASVVV